MNKKTARPPITAYECLLLLCSKLSQKGKVVLRQDALVSQLYKFKDCPSTKIFLNDIAFKKDSDSLTSLDIEDSLTTLQTFGAIGRLNPAYEKIIIYISPKEAERFLENSEKSFADAAEEISEAL